VTTAPPIASASTEPRHRASRRRPCRLAGIGATYRDHLPQLDGDLFLTDGGIETTLIFHDGIDLPEFAAFPLLETGDGRDALRRYFRPYLELARERGAGFLLETPTWRANRDWGARLGYSEDALVAVNRDAIAFMEELRDEHVGERPFVISGCIGPQGDGYDPDELLSADAAEAYHRAQIETFAGTAADLVTALTMTYPEEAIGVVRAAAASGIPAAISFTVETDGRLPNGDALPDAVARVDAETDGSAAYFMVNCAHPTHFQHVLTPGAWRERVRGVRANASTKSHAELDEAEELDAGDPVELAARYVELRQEMPQLNVLGGCCGTDHRHIAAIAGEY
jgi:S-methylmethionine-dependent homocysteine/selenocysteine methylase